MDSIMSCCQVREGEGGGGGGRGRVEGDKEVR